MRTLFNTFNLLALLMFLLNGNANAQNQKLILVRLEREDFNTETFRDVACAEFKSLFKETIENNIFDDSLYLDKFDHLTKIFNNEERYKTIDVRGIITFNYQLIKIEYCFDKFGHFQKDGVIYYNKELFDFITKNYK